MAFGSDSREFTMDHGNVEMEQSASAIFFSNSNPSDALYVQHGNFDLEKYENCNDIFSVGDIRDIDSVMTVLTQAIVWFLRQKLFDIHTENWLKL